MYAMRTTLMLLFFVSICLGCNGPVPNAPILVVATTYPGASAQVVAENVAVPIEQQINGIEGLFYMESESRDDGGYVARLLFENNSDPDKAIQLVQDRISLAKPMLPNGIEGIEIKLQSKAEENEYPVSLALIDRGNKSRESLQSFSKSVHGRLLTDGAMKKLEVFPGPDVDHIEGQIDSETLAKYGVSIKDVDKILNIIMPNETDLEAVKMLPVRSESGEPVPLGSVVEFKLVNGPSGVYRFDMNNAIRISCLLPEGRTAASAVKRWEELAKEERKKQKRYADFQVLLIFR
jgi:multidrug efflux pump subunit AcrB